MNPTILCSTPRQGTDWLINCIKQNNKDIIYYREFFNPLCNKTLKSELTKHFGSEKNIYNILKQTSKDTIIKLIDNLNPNFNLGKEVFTYVNLEALNIKYDLFALYRPRKYTFPSTKPRLFSSIYKSYLIHHTSYVELKPIYKLIENQLYNNIVQQVIGHIIAWYFILKYFLKRKLKIINYSKLLTYDKDQLKIYVANEFPYNLNGRNVSNNIYRSRQNIDWLKRREKLYLQLNVEPIVLNLLNIIKNEIDESIAIELYKLECDYIQE